MSTTTETGTKATLSGAVDAAYIPRGPAEAELTFYVPPVDGSEPYNYVEAPPPGEPQRNYQEENRKVQIGDIRNHESEYTLDTDAFQAIQNVPPTSAEPSFTDEADIKNKYYPEVERLILDHVPGAHRVLIFDHTVRRPEPGAPRGPVTRAHVDQTPRSAEWRVRLHVSEAEADELLKGRYRIINVWRPLNGPVQSHPLAFASGASVDDADLVGVQHRYPNRIGETAGVRFNEKQQWRYWSGMTNDERLLLKCADSADVEGKRSPHSAFIDPRTPPDAKGRASIEVRTLVFG